MNRFVSTLSLLLAGSLVCDAADWRQFRGNAANSVASGERLPTELSGTSIAWKAELPGRGVASPIVVGDRVFLTASSGYSQDRLHILCFDAKEGTRQWERQFQATGRTVCHEKMSVATPTPASDGERVFAFYSSNDLICTDLDGNLQWYRGLGSEYPNASNSLGMASSLLTVGSTVIAQVESDAESFAIGIDTRSGETKWKMDRPRKANWSSPTLMTTSADQQPLVLLQSPTRLSAVDADTGDIVWEFTESISTVSSSSVIDGTVYVPSNGLTTIQPKSDSKDVEQIWNASNLSPRTSSPVVLGDLAFTVNSAGALSAGDIESGKRLWQLRLKGPFSGTPVVSNDHLYFFNENGQAFVVKPDVDSGEIVSQLDLNDTILSSPAASNNALYIRSDGQLWKFADPG